MCVLSNPLGDIRIEQVPLLTSLVGLHGIYSCASIILEALPMLITLAGLAGLRGAQSGSLTLKNLRTLSIMNLQA